LVRTAVITIEVVEGETEEAFEKRRELVRLLVETIAVDRSEDGELRVEITYRFGPPSERSGEAGQEDGFVGGGQVLPLKRPANSLRT
jgi:hypothetical protein